MHKGAQKAIFDEVENHKDKQAFRFMHCWLYLKAYPQVVFIECLQEGYKKLLINIELLILDLIMSECQTVQGLGGSPIGEL
jgi:hypothetical protein